MKYAPIAIFIYNRPKHTERMLASLMKCPEFAHSPVYVFCDGPKTSEDEPMIQATRRLARKMIEHQAEFSESDQNRGPDRSIISAVSQLCQSYERVTVFEDDLIVAPNVLHYFNAALERYEQEERVHADFWFYLLRAGIGDPVRSVFSSLHVIVGLGDMAAGLEYF